MVLSTQPLYTWKDIAMTSNSSPEIDHESIALGLKKILREAKALHVQGDFTVAKKVDGSPLTQIDTHCESALIAILKVYGGGHPILAEEDDESVHIELGSPPRTFWSIDPIDGTTPLSAGYPSGWNISVGLIEDGLPTWGAIAMPDRDSVFLSDMRERHTHRDVNPNRMLGLDLAPNVVANPLLWEFNRSLIREFGYPANVPSVQSGLDFVQGRTRLWVSANTHHWDIAATAACALRQEGVVIQHIDERTIDWSATRDTFQPLMFAESESVAQRVRELYAEAVKSHSKD